MTNQAKLYLGVKNNEIEVKYDIDFREPVNTFIFSINASLIIDNIYGNTSIVTEKIREWNPVFRANSQEICIQSQTSFTTLTICYHGKVTAWCNIIEENKVALSSYSVWCPQEANLPLNTLYYITDMSEFFIINAQYDAETKIWIYGISDHDAGNIIALKNGKYWVAQTGTFSFYYVNELEKAVANDMIKYYGDIISYYNTIFGVSKLNKMDIVSLGHSSGGGAYFRKELVVIERIQCDMNEANNVRLYAAGILGHELAHNWFMGAPSDTWEDWLNETGATWASLIYALDNNDIELFKNLLGWPEQVHKNSPIIKTPDLKRPDGVHGSGTMMLYEIFKKYGKEPIIVFLQSFVEIEEKTTNNLLTLLRKKIGNEIPSIIEKGLIIEDFSELCTL